MWRDTTLVGASGKARYRRERSLRLGMSAGLGLALLLGTVVITGGLLPQVRAGLEPASFAPTVAKGAQASGWLTETVDSEGYVGTHTSLALAPSPPYTPHISYFDGWPNYSLKHAWWTPSGWLSETVDSGGVNRVGWYTSLALEPTPPYTPHISYQDRTNRNLKHAWLSGTTWYSETVDWEGDVGDYTSLALEPTPPYTAHISYQDWTHHDLRHACWTPDGWLTETVDSVGMTGYYPSLALEPVLPYTPHISYDYYDGSKHVLMHAWQGASSWFTEGVDSQGTSWVGDFTSLALEPTSPYTPHISYRDISANNLKHAWWTPSGWLNETVDSEGDVGLYTSLELEPIPPYAPHITYHDATNDALKHAWWTPSGWLSEAVDSVGDGDGYNSLALEPTAAFGIHIAYYDITDLDLRHAWLERRARIYLPLVLRGY